MIPVSSNIQTDHSKEVEYAPKKGATPKGRDELGWFSQFKFSATAGAKYHAGMYFSVGLALCFTPAIVVGLPLCFYGLFYKFAFGLSESSKDLHGADLRKHVAESFAHFGSGMLFALEIPLYLALKAAVDHGLTSNKSVVNTVKFMDQHHLNGPAETSTDQPSTPNFDKVS
jgi:hypothetical protein